MSEPFRMSPHAIDRALEMGVTGEEIRACYDKPDESYWSQTHEKWCYKRGHDRAVHAKVRSDGFVECRLCKRLMAQVREGKA